MLVASREEATYLASKDLGSGFDCMLCIFFFVGRWGGIFRQQFTFIARILELNLMFEALMTNLSKIEQLVVRLMLLFADEHGHPLVTDHILEGYEVVWLLSDMDGALRIAPWIYNQKLKHD